MRQICGTEGRVAKGNKRRQAVGCGYAGSFSGAVHGCRTCTAHGPWSSEQRGKKEGEEKRRETAFYGCRLREAGALVYSRDDGDPGWVPNKAQRAAELLGDAAGAPGTNNHKCRGNKFWCKGSG